VIIALVLFGLSIAAYIPMSNAFGPSQWLGWGPFEAQISRVFVHLLHFLAGIAIVAPENAYDLATAYMDLRSWLSENSSCRPHGVR
jgi:hypothetical protein